ncbi:MAG: Ig-like domain-containing protein [Clostridiales bacterium]|nr:Ig-like domain-containing protein [Clostridiales bacterium]
MRRKLTVLSLMLVICIPLLTSCGTEMAESSAVSAEQEAEETAEAGLAVAERSLLLSAGDAVTLTVTGAQEEISFVSSDPDVAVVDEEGTVAAKAQGNALITVSSGGETAYCGVIVDCEEELIDLSGMTANAVFTDVDVERSTTMRGLAVDADSMTFYISQSAGTLPSDMMISKVESVDGVYDNTEFMHAYESGYGGIALEQGAGGEAYLWLESNGTLDDIGTTVSRTAWEDGVLIQREYGDTISFAELDGYVSPQIDLENDWLVVRAMGADGSYCYYFYDRSSVLAGEEAIYLHSVTCAADQTPIAGNDDSNGRYGMVTFRGFTVGGGYIYQVQGNSQGKIYVSVFNMEGELMYVHIVTEYEDMIFREPEAVSYADGKLYLLLTSGESGDYLANVLVFEEGVADEAAAESADTMSEEETDGDLLESDESGVEEDPAAYE